MSRLLKDRPQQHSTPGVLPYDQIESVTLVDANLAMSVQTPNPVALTEFPGRIWPLLVVFKAADRGMTQEVMIKKCHDLQSENVLLLVIVQTYGVYSHHDGHSYVCSMGLWFLLRTVCCNCCKRSDTQHSLLCSLYSVSVLQWPQRMTSQCQHWLSFCTIDIFFCQRVDIHRFGYHHQSLVWVVLLPGNHEGFWDVSKPWLVCSGKYPSTHLMTRWWTNYCLQYPWSWVGQDDMSAQMGVLCRLRRLWPVWQHSISAHLSGFVNGRSYDLLQITTAAQLICQFFGI